jgi:small-conductance mechanosensitive channel/CRP-like cAMP-binding protein
MSGWPVFAFVVLLAIRLWGARLVGHQAPPFYAQLLVQVASIGLVLAAAVVVDRLVRLFYWHRYLKRRRNRETPALIQDITSVALLAAALGIGLWWQAGLTLTGIAAASGAVAFVLGIALQPVIQDLFSGLSINFDASYGLGDWITVYSDQMPEPTHGRVTGINWRTTFLTLDDGRRMMIPNRMITSNPVANHSRAPAAKQLSVQIPVEIRLPRERAIDMLLGEAFKAAREHGLAREPAPEILVKQITGDAVIYDVRFHYYPDQTTPSRATSAVLNRLHAAIQQNNLPMPVTQIEMTEPPNLETSLDLAEIKAVLCRVPLFREALDDKQFDALAEQCRPTVHQCGATLMRQGDPAASMYVLIEGAASVVLLTPDGNSHEAAISSMGDVAGEMSLMTGAPRTATVIALTRLRALEITKEAIQALLKEMPALYERFSAILALRQHELDLLAERHTERQEVQKNILSRMKSFFSRSFRSTETA